MDEYTYQFLAATDALIYGNYDDLRRDTEASGAMNAMRQSFYKVNENTMKVLIPHFFSMHESLFTHIDDVKDGVAKFMRVYGYISGLSLIWVNTIILLIIGNKLANMSS